MTEEKKLAPDSSEQKDGIDDKDGARPQSETDARPLSEKDAQPGSEKDAQPESEKDDRPLSEQIAAAIRTTRERPVEKAESWTLSRVIAWIRTRDYDRVEAAEKLTVLGCWCASVDLRESERRALRNPNYRLLLPSEKHREFRDGTTVLEPSDAVNELWKRLKKGTLSGNGCNVLSGKRVRLDPIDWEALHVEISSDSQLVLSANHTERDKPVYRNILFNRSDVVKIWRPQARKRPARFRLRFTLYLVKEMKSSPEKRILPKKDYEKTALESGVSKAEFEKIWRDTAEAHAKMWMKGGRPRKT